MAALHRSLAARQLTRMVSARGLILLAIFVYTQFFWTRTLGILPRAVNWLDDVLVIGLGALALLRVPAPARLPRTWAWAMAAFVLLAIVSAVSNNVPWWRGALALRGILLYVGLYWAVVVTPLSAAEVQRVAKAIVGLVALQVPVQVVEFLNGVRVSGWNLTALADVAPGTLGEGLPNDLGLLFIPFIAGAVALWAVGSGRRWLWLAALLVLGLVLASARAALMLLPGCLLLIAGLTLGWRRLVRPRTLLGVTLLALLGFGVADMYYRATTGEGVTQQLSPARLLSEQLTYSPATAARLAYYPVTWNVLLTDAASPWLGLGPGNYGSGAAYVTNAPGLALIRDIFGQFETGRETALNAEFLATLGEYGIAGTALLFFMLWAVARRTLVVRRSVSDLTRRTVLAGVFVGQLVFVIGAFLEYLWEDQPVSFTFWLSAALVTKLAHLATVRGAAAPALPPESRAAL